MTPSATVSLPEGVKVLSEAEIQKRLYGKYFAPLKPKANPSPPQHVTTDSQWTGVEILSLELKRLRSELVSLRTEKERLGEQLARQGKQHRPVQRVEPTMTRGADFDSMEDAILFAGRGEEDVFSVPLGWKLFGKCVGIAFIVATIGVPLVMLGVPWGARFLQASPMVGDPTPYTIQVAVYDGKKMAVSAIRHLRELGYSAFLEETTRRDGRQRYRIYVGQFVTKVEAQIAKEHLAADQRFSNSFVRLQ